MWLCSAEQGTVLFLLRVQRCRSPALPCSAAGLHPLRHAALPYIQYGGALIPCGCARQRALPHRCPVRCTRKRTKRTLNKKYPAGIFPAGYFCWEFLRFLLCKEGTNYSQPSLVSPQPSQSLTYCTALRARSGSRRCATWIIRAQSIRLRKILHPYS